MILGELPVRKGILNDLWWDKIDYILTLTDHIYNMLGICSTGASTLHLVYEMRDSWQWQPYIGIISKRKQMRYANLDGARVVLHFIVWSIHLIQGNFFKLIFYLWIKIIIFHSSITLISVYRYHSEEWHRKVPKRGYLLIKMMKV